MSNYTIPLNSTKALLSWHQIYHKSFNHTSQLFTHFLSLLIMKIGDETKKHRQKHQQGPEPDKPNHQLSSRAVNITDSRDRLGDCMAGVVRTGHQSNTQGPLR